MILKNMSWQEYQTLVEHLASKINFQKYDCIYAIPKGGTFLGTILAYASELPIVYNLDYTWFEYSSVLVVDDLIDKGITLYNKLHQTPPRFKYDVAVLFLKPHIFTPQTKEADYVNSLIKSDRIYYAELTDDWLSFPYERVGGQDFSCSGTNYFTPLQN